MSRTGIGWQALSALTFSVLLLSVSMQGGCGAEASTGARPRLVWLHASCSVNADQLAPYSDDIVYTPRLSQFADESVVFERHMTEAGQSGPAYASIFSGRHADGHGIYRHPSRLNPEIPLMTSVFRESGFFVETWLAHWLASAEFGYARGSHRAHDFMVTADAPDLVRILATVRDHPEARVLVVSTDYMAHSPYSTKYLQPFCRRSPSECELLEEDPKRFREAADYYQAHHLELSNDLSGAMERESMDSKDVEYLAKVVELLYRSNLSRLDYYFGTLLDAIEAHGLADESLVVYTADHGEALYRKGLRFPWTHGYALEPEVLRVPLMIRGPGLAPRRYSSVTRSTDLLPTITSLSGLLPPALPDDPWNGVDLSGAILGHEAEPALQAYSHLALFADSFLELTASWKAADLWPPRIDPALIWAQLRSGDSVARLEASRDADASVALEPVFHGPKLADPDATLAELHAYRHRLLEARQEHLAAEAVDEEREKELLRRLGYIE